MRADWSRKVLGSVLDYTQSDNEKFTCGKHFFMETNGKFTGVSSLKIK